MKMILELAEANVRLLQKMIDDVPEDAMSRQLPGIPNHAAWQVGHLAVVRGALGGMVGIKATLPADWGPKFGPNSTPLADAKQYPSKQELFETFTATHRTVVDGLRVADDAAFEGPTPIPQLVSLFPTKRILMAALFGTHDGLHLGQLSVWRRAMGLPRVI